MRPGSHLDLIGSFTPQMREADDDCFANASVFVDTDEAAKKSGELLGPMSRGILAERDIRGTLAGLCQGSVPGRQFAGKRTVFKSVGTPLEDLAAAILVYESPTASSPPVAACHCANFHDAHSSPRIMKVISRQGSGNRFSNDMFLVPLGLTRPLRADLLGGLWDNPGVTDPPDGNA